MRRTTFEPKHCGRPSSRCGLGGAVSGVAEGGYEGLDGLFGGGGWAEDFVLAGGVGDVLAGAEPGDHRAHVLEDRHEGPGDRADPPDQAFGYGAHLDLRAEAPAGDVGDVLHADGPTPANVEGFTIDAERADSRGKVAGKVGGAHEGQWDGLG